MITLDSLIANVPEASDLDAMSEWIAEVARWAQTNKEHYLFSDAKLALSMGEQFNDMPRYRRQLLSQLKAISKEQK